MFLANLHDPGPHTVWGQGTMRYFTQAVLDSELTCDVFDLELFDSGRGEKEEEERAEHTPAGSGK